jgi:Arc/MetJ-type ribon-helix-helix transcriptional regulator
MSTIAIQLPRKLKPYLDEETNRRGYKRVSEFVEALVEAERHRDIRAELEQMLLEAVEGPFEEWTDKDVEDIRRVGTALIKRQRKQRKTR